MIIDGSFLAIFRLLYSLIPNRPTDQRQVRWLSTVVVLMLTLFDFFPILSHVLLNKDLSYFENTVDPDQLASIRIHNVFNQAIESIVVKA